MMADKPSQRPHIEDLPGAWPSASANSFRQNYLNPLDGNSRTRQPLEPTEIVQQSELMTLSRQSSTQTAVAMLHPTSDVSGAPTTFDALPHTAEPATSEKSLEEYGGPDDSAEEDAHFQPINTRSSHKDHPKIHSQHTGHKSEAELFQALSRRKTNASGRNGSISSLGEDQEEQAEIERLMSRMFGGARQAQSEDEKTRHVGVVFKNLTVKGVGLGAALQPTLSGPFLGLPRLIRGLFKNPRAATGKPPIRTIVNNFNGCIRPGEMLLVLGRPGSGCSTFLKVLANQRSGYKSVDGEVTYGGTSSEEMKKNYTSEIVYNPEDDLHYATLTVKETLKFALKTRTPGKASRNEGETRQAYVKEFLRVVAKLFWIEHTMDTKVGDEFVRGVSGGEKKRVSIAEAMITKASTQCWDNSTRGLDASTALEYVQSLRSLTNMANISTSVALYQAGESLYQLFDKVILIDEGRCLYYGKSDDAAAHFEGLGFSRPARWTTADFLTSVTDRHARQVQKGWEDRIPRTAEQFEQAFIKSSLHDANLRDIEEFEKHTEEQRREREAASTKATKKKNYTLPFHKQVLACTNRQFLVIWGDKLTLGAKWGGIFFQALIVGSIFYNMPQTSNGVFTRGGVLFLLLLFNALLALAELTQVFSSRPILLKHKTFSFYRPAAYAIAQTVVDVPLVVVQVVIFDVVIYFMSGLGRTASQFFISLLTLWISTMTMYSFFRAMSAWSKSLDTATQFTGVAIQALIVYTGYFIPPIQMRPWFKWLMYINPVAYGFEILMANEFDGLAIQCEPPNLVPQGPNVTSDHQSCTIQGSQPGSTIVNGGDYIGIAFNYYRSHLWRNVGILFAFWIGFVVLTMIGQERQKANSDGGAVTVFKRGQAPAFVSKAMEKGSTALDEEKAAVENGKLEDEATSSEDSASTQKIAKNEAVFTYQNVNYTIPVKDGERQLLRDVQGFVRPGKLTALMGASGAGKTTLLNTLAQRINFGVVTGDFLVDGRPLPNSFQRATGFAEQMDIHEPTATVREALRFSALLRQPKEVPTKEKYDYCERIIDLLEMRPIAGATIGRIGEGLNQEQRKRLTIGVELASKPELLMFLDEPTSGLDSGAAFNIIRFLRKLADAGQAILCTIHQPSSVLFEEFDELLLLKSGGRVVYHGSLGKDSRNLIDYFEANGARKCPPSANPAEYMLEAIGAGNPDYKGQDWGDVWANSREYKDRAQEIQDMIQERRHSATTGETDDNREYAMPIATQIYTVVKRSFTAYWRTPDYMIGKFALHIITGLFNVFTFYRMGQSQLDFQSRLFSIFMTLTISPPLIQQLQPKFLDFRNIYKSREANSKIYSWVAFTTGAILVELPYTVLAGTVYLMCWWWGAIGRGRSGFDTGYTWMMLMLFEIYYVGFGQAIASFSPNENLASLLVPAFFLFVISFCGVVVPFAAIPTFWRSWMYYLTPFRYITEGFLSVAVHDLPLICADNEFARFLPPPGQSCQAYVQPFIAQAGGYVQDGIGGLCEYCQYASGDEFAAGFNVFYHNKWIDYGVVFAYCVFNFMVVYACSWLYLGGTRKIRRAFSGAGKKQAKTQRVGGEKA